MEKKNLKNKKAKVSKPKESKSTKSVKTQKLDPKKFYAFESNGKHRLMPKGKVVSVTGATAAIFLQQGYGKLKK